jgi:hypothetical protein
MPPADLFRHVVNAGLLAFAKKVALESSGADSSGLTDAIPDY